ncbi:MAG TPA: hypothetical protein VFS60_03055, partial [Thermoanaerobaculia bacterium]|nr:hypothetical protein [Thermoanaerobaculia bacterium]
MTKWTLLAAALSAVIVVIVGGTACKPAGPSRDGSGTLVSLIQLIAVPQQYDHKKVIVVGYLHLEMEGNALYLHESDFQRGLTPNALRLQFERGHEPVGSAAADGYVLVQGVF